jgi:uncharacterized protein YrzB (UPF0473 family)
MMEKVELIKNDGSKLSLDLISIFNAQENNKKYIILTANEIDQNGLIKVLVSEINDGQILKVTSDDDWTIVKNVMRAIISSSKGNYSYLSPNGSALSYVINDDFARIIAVQESAKEQLIKDYEAHKPAPEVEKKPEAPKPIDPNAAIYPQGIPNQPVNNEITPGIAEVSPVSAPAVSATENNNPVSSVVNDIQNNPVISANEVVKQDNNVAVTTANSAKEAMVNKIMAAVEEYIANTSATNNNAELEINTLKNNIQAMQEQLNAMANTINTQE